MAMKPESEQAKDENAADGSAARVPISPPEKTRKSTFCRRGGGRPTNQRDDDSNGFQARALLTSARLPTCTVCTNGLKRPMSRHNEHLCIM